MKKITILSFFVLYPTYAFAYIDPGTVSILLQGLIAALAASIVTIKIYWNKILKLLRIKKETTIDQEIKNKDTK